MTNGQLKAIMNALSNNISKNNLCVIINKCIVHNITYK